MQLTDTGVASMGLSEATITSERGQRDCDTLRVLLMSRTNIVGLWPLLLPQNKVLCPA